MNELKLDKRVILSSKNNETRTNQQHLKKQNHKGLRKKKKFRAEVHDTFRRRESCRGKKKKRKSLCSYFPPPDGSEFQKVCDDSSVVDQV